MRATRSIRAFTLMELCVSIISAAMLVGMVAMAMRISLQTRNQRSDQNVAIAEAREALDTIERLVSRAVEIKEWDAFANTPVISDGSGEAGDSFLVSVTTANRNLGSGNKPFTAGDVITHNGAQWNVALAAPVAATWDPTSAAAQVGGSVGEIRRVQGPGPAPWLDNVAQPPNAPVGGLPNRYWYPGDMVQWTGPVTKWKIISWRADVNRPPISDASAVPIGTCMPVSVGGSQAPVMQNGWVPKAVWNLGSGPMDFVSGDHIVMTPFGWRKLGHQCAIRNFKNPVTGADDDISGIHFYADVDPSPPPPGLFDVDVQNRKFLEWVWIWWDKAQDKDQWPVAIERRGPIKIAIFRAQPHGNPANTHDLWTRNGQPFFNLINAPTVNRRKPYFTTAASFGTVQMKVQEFLTPAVNAAPPLVSNNANGLVFSWSKRVAITGGVFQDRTGELASIGTNPWDEVAPGSKYVAGAGARFTQVPSFTFSRAIYADNASAVTDPQNRPFTFNPNVSGINNVVRNSSIGWQTGYSVGTVKNDYVIQPR